MLNHEEGGERSVEDGDEHAETTGHEFGAVLAAERGRRDPVRTLQHSERPLTDVVHAVRRQPNLSSITDREQQSGG